MLLAAAPARGQIGASAVLQSDNLYRGHSLSGRRPTLGLNLAYDHPSGAYAGASLTAPLERDSQPGLVDYVGYVARLGSRSLDLGITDAHLIGYRAPRHRIDYQEVYAGLLSRHLSVHLHYSPNYFHTGAETLYADFDGVMRSDDDNWRVFGHLGALTPLSAPSGRGSHKERYDFSAGVARRFLHSEVSLTWSQTTPVVIQASGQPQDRAGLVLSAAYFF